MVAAVHTARYARGGSTLSYYYFHISFLITFSLFELRLLSVLCICSTTFVIVAANSTTSTTSTVSIVITALTGYGCLSSTGYGLLSLSILALGLPPYLY
jgi:hypothetical protein